MKRREFLHNTGWFVVGASLLGIPGCDDSNKMMPADGAVPEPEPKGTYSFPQGVASGDPRDTSVVLWTRAIRNTDDTKDVALRVQVSDDSSFNKLFADHLILATSASDHTVRVLVTQLSPGRAYFYRFVAGSDAIVGQTRTAPDAKADVQVNLAWVSCQDYAAGHYGAYRQMLIDDDARAEADKIHAVVHLGDMIYETRADGFQTAIDDNFQPIMLTNPGGAPRAVAAFPSGGGTRAGVTFAATVEDYRHLYRTFLSDPDLQAARARWPFISVWDDHEFTDDCWQSQANYTSAMSLDEPDQPRRVAASQAWFEYVPVQLTGAVGVAAVATQAKDFATVDVVSAAFTAPNADNFVDEPNNAKAIAAITIYRSLRFGKHVELVMSDLRSYRSDHAIPEDLIAAANAAQPGTFAAPRNALPLPVVGLLDQGKTALGGNPPPTVLGLPNPRVGSPVGTMLGKAQKAWWKATMKGSDATWKLWGNEVTLMRMRIESGGLLPADLVVSGDSWDGYPTERAELMTYLKDQSIKNVVALSGDIHASFAGVIMDNFDAATPTPVACELVAAGISSNSLFSFFESATRAAPAALRGIITVDATSAGGAKFTENFNLLLLDGTAAANEFATNKNLTAALALKTTPNPHLKYADTNAQGYGYAAVTADAIKATIVTINRPITTPSATSPSPGIKHTASFTIPKDNPAGVTGPVFSGTKPFPTT